jgi:hypothetical protein
MEPPDGLTDDPFESIESLRKIKKFALERNSLFCRPIAIGTPGYLENGAVYRPSSLKLEGST